MESDSAIRKNVIEELDFDPTVTATGIGVAVKDGIVTLSGHVPNFAEKYAASRAAQRVKGVRGVVQDIVVRIPGDAQQDDDEIAEHALNVLRWSAGGIKNLKVVVDAGWVTLNGEAPWNYQRQAAERLVRNLSGVVNVTNAIAVRPTIPPTAVADSIRRAFERHADIDSGAIKVQVDGSHVTLSGKVRASYERRMAEEAAWAVPGVTTVQDNLTL